MKTYYTCTVKNWVPRTLAPYLLALLTAACGSAYEPRKDEIECALPDGSSFILRSTYLGLKPVHRHPTNIWIGGSREVNRSLFETYYRPPNGDQEFHAAGGKDWGLFVRERNNPDFMAWQCASNGLINGVPYSLSDRFMPSGADEFQTINVNDESYRAVIYDSRIGETRFADVEARSWRFDRYAIVWRPGLLVMENALVAKDAPDPAPVVGAYRIESRDGGQTWGNPHLTIEPEVFELSKPAAEHCFVARLVRIDIKGTVRNFEASFPDCPVAFALPERKQ
ncbi:hypothetical protein IAI53_02125 [Thauera sp. CAU 1555]|uniref:Exo-alpha-sialidase n=1 Tax=Thauera sedimentorum TaxID=2767595 RepID=A0ABR9B5L5_9RHOO|nr:hypothetical protein [Thauera sedimentorum]MBC9070750.1 hypothetical protein [Thauera sedimentorum]MBD8501669.1 hypothetical protein [Thauera sedimentorum]